MNESWEHLKVETHNIPEKLPKVKDKSITKQNAKIIKDRSKKSTDFKRKKRDGRLCEQIRDLKGCPTRIMHNANRILVRSQLEYLSNVCDQKCDIL